MFGFDTTVYCTDPERRTHSAKYKVAAVWTGGGYSELKTYGFADDACVERVVESARRRAARVPLAEGEHLGPVTVYHLEPGKHDYELTVIA